MKGLQYILWLGFSCVLGFPHGTQAQDNPLISFDGHTLTWSLKKLGHDGVLSSGGKVVVNSAECPKGCPFVILVKSKGPRLDDLAIKIAPSKAWITIRSVRQLDLSPAITSNFEVTNMETIWKPENGSISFSILEKNNEAPLATGEIPVRFNPLPEANALADCLTKSTEEAMLKCLYGLPNPGPLKETVVRESLKLEKKKNIARKQLDGIELSRSRLANRYELTCKGCNWNDLVVDTGAGVRKKSGRYYEAVNSSKNVLVVSSKEWPGLSSRRFVLGYTSAGRNQVDAEPEKETAEETPWADTSRPENEMESLNEKADDIAESIQPSPPLPDNRQPSEYWEDSIAAYLDIPHFLFLKRDDLNTRLALYLGREGPKEKAGTARLWLNRHYLFGLLLLLGLAWVWRSQTRPKAMADLPAENESGKAKKEGQADSSATRVDSSSNGMEKEKELDFDIDISEVKQERAQVLDRSAIFQWVRNTDLLPISLDSCWEDTAVTTLFFSRDSIEDIQGMVQELNTDVLKTKSLEEVPEIGGFLLGKVARENPLQFAVIIERFVPITAESQNRYTIKFGDKAWTELDDALHTFNDLHLVGWFHTHPGHGLFLSEADLREHHQLFGKRYQLAVEIDPTTEGLQIAFFSWTKEGDVNNQADKKLDEWWKFEELQQQLNEDTD